MNLDAYCQRIGCAGPHQPTEATLRRLHYAHLLTVPFENLDIHLQRPIVLDEQRLYDKIVIRRRGGFCYEQNGVFAAVLRQVGFRVTLLEARVGAKSWDQAARPYDHMALMVEANERWLADVGFGDSFMEPLRLDDPSEQVQPCGTFRIVHDGFEGVLSRKTQAGDWNDEFRFRLVARSLQDFSAGCDYHQYSEKSHFTQQRICSQATPNGRITLSDRRLITTHNGVRHEQDLESEAEFLRHLRHYFQINLSTD